MVQTASSLTPAPGAALAPRGGLKLRQIRERLNLTLREVEEASLRIAASEGHPEYLVSGARLNQIENDGSLPSVYKLFSLAVVYQLSIEEVMSFYGINLGRLDEKRSKTLQGRTHLFSVEAGDPNRPIRFPVRFDPGFSPQKTSFVSRMVEMWGEIPAGLLATLDLKKHRYGYIGLEDRTMDPLLRPGSIVQIDENRRRVANLGWSTQFDRPIYFLELHYSYQCCWCYQRGRELTLLPHPASPCGPRMISIPEEGEVLGQVVGIAMRIAE